MFKRILCKLDLHKFVIIPTEQDPYRFWDGHRGTVKCKRCGAYARVIGYDKCYFLGWQIDKQPSNESED